MKSAQQATTPSGLSSLRNFVAKRPKAEVCDLCAVPLAEEHQHLVDPVSRRLLCACDACAILFACDAETKYRRVPRDVRRLNQFALSDQAWNSLAVPIGLVFIFQSSAASQMLAVYPSPAGPTENTVDPDSWEQIMADNAFLAKLTPDVEALLINRLGGLREYFTVPIDECYKLTGIVRKYWRGLSGGEEGQDRIASFFNRLKERSYPGVLHA